MSIASSSIASPVAATVADSYLDLISRFPLRPIRDEEEFARADVIVCEMFGRKELDAGESDYLEALLVFYQLYEETYHAIDTSDISPRESLQYVMERAELTVDDVDQILGSSDAAAILAGDRVIAEDEAERLGAYFHVDPSLFLYHDPPPPSRPGERSSMVRAGSS